MKSLLVAGWMVWSAFAATPPAQGPAPTVLGPKGFLDGDVIEITDVQATSAKLEQGDTVTVRGKYRLASHGSADLALFTTATEGNGVGEIDPQQTTRVESRRGEFELQTTISCRGALHVSFYDLKSGQTFGGVYFGTAEQMKAIEGWDMRMSKSEWRGD